MDGITENVIHDKVSQAYAIVTELFLVLKERTWEEGTNHIPGLAEAAAGILSDVENILYEIETAS